MQIPKLVKDAKQAAARLQFHRSCLDEVGELLALLVGHSSSFPVLEVGTGAGVGTAWLASQGGGPIYTVEIDEDLAEAARTLFATEPQITVVTGDWASALSFGPFGLVFADVKSAKREGADQLVGALQPGGWIVLDDLTPMEYWPEEWRGKTDLVRETWLQHPGLMGMEIRTSARVSVIVARRTWTV